jgi:hypothetical protein
VFACNLEPSSNPDDYIGEYVLTPQSAVSEGFANFLILKKDNKAVVIRYNNASGQITTEDVNWGLSRYTTENIDLNNSSYPIKRTGSNIRITLNDDLGLYYVKIQ